MADETVGVEDAAEEETIEEAEAETVEVEAEAESGPEENSDEETQEEASDEETEEDQEPEVIEFDFGGNKMALPKDSIPEDLAEQIDKFTKGTWSDYTKKSQDVAEQRKALETREGAVQRMEGLNGEALTSYATGLQLKAEIEQLQNIDMQALWQSDPDQARRVSDTISAKQAQFQTTVNDVAQKEQELTQTQQAELDRRKDEGKQLIERQVPGFESLHLNDVVTYATESLGVDPDAAKSDWALNPAMTTAVYKSMLFDRMQAEAKKPAKKAAQPKPVKPVAKKGGTRESATPSDGDDVDTWLRKRQRQLERRA